MRWQGKSRAVLLLWFAQGLLVLGWSICGRGLRAQPAPPAPGVVFPPALYSYLQENPGAFRFERAWLAVAQRARKNRARATEKTGSGAHLRAAGSVQVSGTMRVPVLLGKFANTGHPPFSPGELQQALFDGPWPTGTLSDYYREASYGHLTLTGQVTGWFTVSGADTFYSGGSNGIGANAKTGHFLREMLDASDPLIDFGQFDNDGPDGRPNSGDDDGFVDFVTFVHPEPGGECGNGNIWSHRWTYSAWWGESYATQDPSANGGVIRVQDYVIAPGVNCDGDLIEKGIFCHEFGHAFGLPDLYDLDQSSEGVGNWCLMASGNWNSPASPAHFSAWCKVQLGWILPREISPQDSSNGAGDTFREITLLPVQESPDVVKIPLDAAGMEYFLLENRPAKGFDAHLPGTGLLIWHVDERKPGNSEEWYPGRDPSRHYRVALEPADGAWDLEQRRNRGDAADPFWEGRFTCYTRPGSDSYQHGSTGVVIRNIHFRGEILSAEIGFRCAGAQVAVQPPEIRWTLPPGRSLTANLSLRNEGSAAAPPLRWQLMERPAAPDSSPPLHAVPPGNFATASPPDLQKGQRDRRTHPAPALSSSGGDAFGYRWQTGDEPDGPAFHWEDISAEGTPVALADDDALEVELPFLFPFYGELYHTVKISANGYLTFGPDGKEYRHRPLPDPQSPNHVIAGLWRDLNPALGGQVYFRTAPDGHRWTVQYQDVPTYRNDARVSFQMILFKDGTMLFQYRQIPGDGVGSVGIENGTGTIGLPVAFNSSFLRPGLAIRLGPADALEWLTPAETSGEIQPGQSQDVSLEVQTADLSPGVYRGVLAIHSNDPVHALLTVPVELAVVPQLAVSVRAFLQGALGNVPAAAAPMRTDLSKNGWLPLQQPYHAAPWHYNGPEKVEEIPAGTVDWLLLQLCRDASGEEIVATRAVLLMADGRLVATDGTAPLVFENVPEGSYFVRLEHRNHLAVISRAAVAPSHGVLHWDFTADASSAAGYQSLTKVGTGRWALRAGDANGDGGIDLRDKNLSWRLQNGRQNGYFSADFSLDGRVDGTDLDSLWRKNNGRAAQK